MKTLSMEYKTLNNGIQMPLLGFGVFQITDMEECIRAVSDALTVGYRLIDTASIYGNEVAVGKAISLSGIPRDQLFVTTKAWISEMGYERTLSAFEQSLVRLGLEYIDLYLIHMPFGDYYGTWKALERLYNTGRVRAIGVCNFEPDRLIDLCQNVEVIPAVNQIEIHPFTQQKNALEIMHSLNVQPEAWGPFAEGRNGLFQDETLISIGRKYGKTAAQVVLQWHRQQGIIAIPKSINKERIIENFSVGDFFLSQDDMDAISIKDTGHSIILDLHDPKEVYRLYRI